MVLWVVGVSVLLCGGVLLVWGWRGRRVNNHPVCRACGFDLLGIAPVVPRCPECGRDVTTAGAVRRGVRRRRHGAIAVACVLLLVGATGTGLLATLSARGTNWNTYKPAWLLQRELTDPDVATADGAGAELAARIQAGSLSTARTERVVDAALALQADAGAPWSSGIAAILARSRAADRVSSTQLARFIRQSLRSEVELPDRVARGSGIPMRHTFWHDAPAHWMEVAVLVSSEFLVDGRPARATFPGGAPALNGALPVHYVSPFTNGVVRRGGAGTSTFGFEILLDLPVGRHTITIRARHTALPENAVEWPAPPAVAPEPRSPGDVLLEWTEEQSFEIEVAEGG
jgi:hypothetical protein